MNAVAAFSDPASAATVSGMSPTPGRCPCGLPDCSDAPYVLPIPEYVHKSTPRPSAPVIPAQRSAPVGCWTPDEVAS